MKRLSRADYTAMPWKNGGGTTYEIAISKDGDRVLWRLSTARVETDGGYSQFPGLTRISTVVEGNGTRLIDIQSGEILLATPLRPTRFGGDQMIHGELLDGGLRHLNLFFDAERIAASVTILDRAGTHSMAGDGVTTDLVYCAAGQVATGSGSTLETGDAGIAVPGEAGRLVLASESKAVRISLSPRS